jgi:preprotein translocase subunit SecF
MRLKLVPDDTRIDFMGMRRISLAASGAAIVLALLSLLVLGLNFGIDFRGGTMIMAETPEETPVGVWRDALGAVDVGDVSVTSISDPAAELTGGPANAVMIRIEQGGEDPEIQADAIAEVEAALRDALPGLNVLAVESVGAKVSGELVQAGALAVLLAVGAVLIYIWLRFEWQFALGAVAALVHDVVITMGVFSITALEFNLSIVAALLTIVGYSLNDTVVVYDRIRENLRRFKTKPLEEVLNLSINETLSRTLMTSITTLIALLALYVLGGEVIRGFTFGMILGVIVGTYSSVFVAALALLRLGVARDDGESEAGPGVRFGAPDAP